MRKIKSEAEIERRRKRNNIILGLSMILLMVASTAGFAIMNTGSNSDSKVEENGFSFVRDSGMWKIAFGDEVFGFQNLPSEVADVVVDNVSVQLGQYAGGVLYFVNPGEGTNEILINIGDYLLRYQEACLGEVLEVGNQTVIVPLDECEGDLPIKDCSNNLIVFEQGNETGVWGQDNCVFIRGDFIRGSDAFLYKLLGIN